MNPLRSYIEHKDISPYKLSKKSGVPYSTLNDILNQRTKFEQCSAETVFRLARALNMPMDDLYYYCTCWHVRFDNFKSAACHELKRKGDYNFIIDLLQNEKIRKYFDFGLYLEAYYLLGMLDYLCRIHDMPKCSDYDDIRRGKLSGIVYPMSIEVQAKSSDDPIYKRAVKESIPEFIRFNIVEASIRDVV